MNKHLNIFKPFSHRPDKAFIEDNLSRALVLCLKNNSLLFHEFLRTIFTETEQYDLFQDLLSDINDTNSYELDIQVETSKINEGFSKVFALTMTGSELDMSDFLYEKERQKKQNITDIFISINDIAIVIEVKRQSSDCRNQLYQQIAAFAERETDNEVYPLDFNWILLMKLVNRVDGFQRLIQQPDAMLKDFKDLIQSHNPNWLPVQKLASIDNHPSRIAQVEKRIISALANIEKEGGTILNYNDRIGLELQCGWAKEIVIHVSKSKDDNLKLVFGIWPGNTKGQGTIMLNQLNDKPNWTPPAILEVQGQKFKTTWVYELKFCHFNGHVASIRMSDEHLKPGKKLISSSVHRNHTGKYDRARWGELEAFLDDTLVESFDWRKRMNWKGNFENTNRNYLTMAIGYEILTDVPYSYLKGIDTEIGNLQPLSDFIKSIEKEYANLFS